MLTKGDLTMSRKSLVFLVRSATAAAVVFMGLLAGNAAWSQSMSGPSSSPGLPAGYSTYPGSDKILSVNQDEKTVTVDLVSTGLNFEGYKNGAMLIQVPVGWTVTVDLKVDAGIKHSALIVPWDQRTSSNLEPAFTGSEPADYKVGIGRGQPAEVFTFTADKAGQYALVCGVPGHDKAGMWDEFDVSADVSSPRVLIKS
jgi:sulfocyanin